MLKYTNENGTLSCIIWEIEEDSIGQQIVNFTVNECVGSTAKLYNAFFGDRDELFFVWKEITFYLSDFKEI